MAKGSTGAGLTAEEKSLIKAMLDAGERSQDIHVLINHGRHPTVNHGRIGSAKAPNVTQTRGGSTKSGRQTTQKSQTAPIKLSASTMPHTKTTRIIKRGLIS